MHGNKEKWPIFGTLFYLNSGYYLTNHMPANDRSPNKQKYIYSSDSRRSWDIRDIPLVTTFQ